MVNCQKAPERAVKAEVKNQSDKAGTLAATMGVCNQVILDANKLYQDTLSKLTVEVKKDKLCTDGMCDAEKAAVTQMANKLKVEAESLMAQINKLSAGADKKPAEGCTTEVPRTEAEKKEDAAKKIDPKAAPAQAPVIVKTGVVKQAMNDMGLAAKKITGQENDITKAMAQDKAAEIVEGTQLILSEELAKFLSDAGNKDGKALIVNGKIISEANAVKEAAAKKDLTSCALTTTQTEDLDKAAVVRDAIAKASMLTPGVNKDKRNELAIMFLVKSGDSSEVMLGLTCTLAEGKEKEAGKQARSAIGALATNVKAVEKTEPQLVVAQKSATCGASKDSSTASQDASCGASQDSSKASQDSSAASKDNSVKK
jgi:hypothetical protein